MDRSMLRILIVWEPEAAVRRGFGVRLEGTVSGKPQGAGCHILEGLRGLTFLLGRCKMSHSQPGTFRHMSQEQTGVCTPYTLIYEHIYAYRYSCRHIPIDFHTCLHMHIPELMPKAWPDRSFLFLALRGGGGRELGRVQGRLVAADH